MPTVGNGADAIRFVLVPARTSASRVRKLRLRTAQALYTPRHDWQGISDEAELQVIRDRIPGMAFS